VSAAQNGRAKELLPMLAHLPPSSVLSISLLVICLLLVMAFETTNGFHDAANAVATVIYTNSLKSGQAVVWSGIMNFIGVIVGGISVAYALVELLPPEVLSPPAGSPAVPMLVALFVSACFWNLATCYFGVPNSSSHCIIVAIGNALLLAHGFSSGVDWSQVWKVLEALALSPRLCACGRRLPCGAACNTRPPFLRTAEVGTAADLVDSRITDPDLHRGQFRARHQ
jgi:PiT family inorganic phosphate transporter